MQIVYEDPDQTLCIAASDLGLHRRSLYWRDAKNIWVIRLVLLFFYSTYVIVIKPVIKLPE